MRPESLLGRGKIKGAAAPQAPRESLLGSRENKSRSRLASFVINAQAPDEGNMHTMLHFATPSQKEKYLRPLCDGKIRSCFAMTEPEAAGSDPTQIKTHAEKVGDNWVINGHKWFIS